MNDNKKKTALLDFRALMKNPKAVKLIIYAVLALIVLVFLSEIFSDDAKSKNTTSAESETNSFSNYESQLEKELERAISAINGVGELTIMVTLDSLSETVFAEKGTGVKTVIMPKVRGVAIICEGGDDIIVKQKIVELVSRVLGISTTRISVTQ